MPIRRIGHRYREVASEKTIDVWFPQSNCKMKRGCLAQKAGLICGDFVEIAIESLEEPPKSTEDAYLRLHLLSERFAKPNEINLAGIFGLLPNVAWTSAGPVFPAMVEELRDQIASENHHLTVSSIDKFPRMTDYVIPSGVRIADADRVRLGAPISRPQSIRRANLLRHRRKPLFLTTPGPPIAHPSFRSSGVVTCPL